MASKPLHCAGEDLTHLNKSAFACGCRSGRLFLLGSDSRDDPKRQRLPSEAGFARYFLGHLLLFTRIFTKSASSGLEEFWPSFLLAEIVKQATTAENIASTSTGVKRAQFCSEKDPETALSVAQPTSSAGKKTPVDHSPQLASETLALLRKTQKKAL